MNEVFSVVFDIAQDSATSDHNRWQLLQADLTGQMFQLVAHFKEIHRCLFLNHVKPYAHRLMHQLHIYDIMASDW